MEEKERYPEHTVAWELPTGDSVTKGNYNLADIETKYIPIQTEMISDDKDRKIADLEVKLAEKAKRIKELEDILKTVREFETPRIKRYAVVQYICWKNKPYKIVYCEDAYKDKNGKIVQAWYSGQSHNFKLIKICDTEVEARNLIKQLKG